MFEQKEPQDIFEGIEPPSNLPIESGGPKLVPESAPQAAPVEVTPAASLSPEMSAAPRSGGNLVKRFVIALIIFIFVIVLGFVAYQAVTPSSDTLEEEPLVQGQGDELIPDGKGDGTEEDRQPISPSINPEEAMDSDGDGLSNAQELEFNTSVSKPDTDGDGLGDKEEIQVYGTDPRRADTDSDTYSDGDEVNAGYNPNGPGKILEVPDSLLSPSAE